MSANTIKHFSRQSDGFTVVEVIISLFVSVIIFSIISGLYVMIQNSYSSTDTRSEIVQNGRVILDRLVREIRQAQAISTALPGSPTSSTPTEIQFQDGHDLSTIKYIRYYLNGTNLNRQIIVYYFASDPDTYVLKDATEYITHNPPTRAILEDKVVGEYVFNIDFWGGKLINIDLYLSKNFQTSTISTAVFGRNL